MFVITDLKKLLSIKSLFVIIITNTLLDFLSINEFEKTKIHSALFNRFFCIDIGLVSFAMYVSIIGLVSYLSINRICDDNKKYGIFYITRISREKYVKGKVLSSVIFSAIISALTISQNIIIHRFYDIKFTLSYYFYLLVYTYIMLLSCSILGMSIYMISKNSAISFLSSFIFMTLQAFIVSKQIHKISSKDIFELPIIIILISFFVFVIKSIKNDFITTKIRE